MSDFNEPWWGVVVSTKCRLLHMCVLKIRTLGANEPCWIGNNLGQSYTYAETYGDLNLAELKHWWWRRQKRVSIPAVFSSLSEIGIVS